MHPRVAETPPVVAYSLPVVYSVLLGRHLECGLIGFELSLGCWSGLCGASPAFLVDPAWQATSHGVYRS